MLEAHAVAHTVGAVVGRVARAGGSNASILATATATVVDPVHRATLAATVVSTRTTRTTPTTGNASSDGNGEGGGGLSDSERNTIAIIILAAILLLFLVVLFLVWPFSKSKRDTNGRVQPTPAPVHAPAPNDTLQQHSTDTRYPDVDTHPSRATSATSTGSTWSGMSGHTSLATIINPIIPVTTAPTPGTGVGMGARQGSLRASNGKTKHLPLLRGQVSPLTAIADTPPDAPHYTTKADLAAAAAVAEGSTGSTQAGTSTPSMTNEHIAVRGHGHGDGPAGPRVVRTIGLPVGWRPLTGGGKQAVARAFHADLASGTGTDLVVLIGAAWCVRRSTL